MAFEITEDPEYPLYEYACHEGNYAMREHLEGRARSRGRQRKKP